MKKFLIVSVCLFLLGCAHAVVVVDQDPKSLSRLVVGMSKEQVVSLLGNPSAMELYERSDTTLVEFDTYLVQYPKYEDKVPVCFIDNKLAGWGKTFYQDHFNIRDKRLK